MTEQQRNGYEDDDMRQLLEEIEELEEGKVSIRMTAAADCSSISKKIKVAKGRAKDLGIPLAILNGLLKTRRLERLIADIAGDVPDDLTEMWEDAAGQFSFLAPEGDDEEPVETVAEVAAKRRAKKAKADQEAEQEAGAKVLEELVS